MVRAKDHAFLVALALAAVLHAVVVFAIRFELPEPDRPAARALEILVLRQAAPRAAPDQPEALAQVDRRGEGKRPRVASSKPQPPAPVAAPDPEPQPAEVASQGTSRPGQAAASQRQSLLALAGRTAATVAEGQQQPVDAGKILDSRNAEIARLTREVRARSAAYANRPRRKAISASTREYKYASYLEAWRRKVERIGNLNYPEVAKKRKLHGDLILHVAVRADGRVETIRVLRSSGHAELDEAAVRIVELAAPFAPFPPDIRAEADMLDITRTWQFLDGNRLGWED